MSGTPELPDPPTAPPEPAPRRPLDLVDRRFRDGVSVFAQVVLDVILRLADLVSQMVRPFLR